MATETKNSVPLADSIKSGVENPEKTLTPTPAGVTVEATPTHEKADSVGTEKASKQEAAQGASNGASTESANDIEKKLRRAERFGLPLQLSEQEKRSSRAERFGNVSGLDAPKSSEDLKRKARAERFGVAASSTVDEEEKKKARLAKFGSSTKVDTQEEEKRKARALRFAQNADSRSHTNGKGAIEVNASVTSNGVGGT